MASLLSWLGKEASAVYHQINPFDNGQTYSTVVNNRPPVRYQPPQQQQQQQRPQQQQGPQLIRSAATPPAPVVPNFHVTQPLQLGNLAIKPPIITPHNPVHNPLANFAGVVAHDVGSAAASTGKGLGQIASIPYNVGKTIPATLTNNKVALANANTAANRDINTAAQFAQFLPRAVVQLRNSAAEGLGGNAGKQQLSNYVPQGGVGHALLGNQPIQSLQKVYKDTRAQKGTQQAVANTALTAGMDLLAAKGGVDAGLKGAKGAVKLADNRTPLNAVGAVGKNVNDKTSLTNPINPNLSQADKVVALQKLSAVNQPKIDATLKKIDSQLGTSSKSSLKAPQNIINKANRPSILATHPDHNVEHIRDSLRSKTVINNFNDVPKVVDAFKQMGAKIVKVDTSKMLNPTSFGFRHASIDMKMPNGQLVEHYMPLKEVEAVKKTVGHPIFEKWRNQPPEVLTNNRQFAKDRYISENAYLNAHEQAMARNHLSPSEAKASWAKIEASLTGKGRQLSLKSSTVGDNASRQTPSLPRMADKSLESPNAVTYMRPSSALSAKNGGVRPVIPSSIDHNLPNVKTLQQLAKQLTTPPRPPKINTPTVGTKPLGLVKTVATSPQTTAGLSRDIQGSYNPLANKVAMRAAQQRIATDPNAAYQFAASTHSAEGNATAIQLAKQLEAEGKHDQAANLIVAKSKQALQAGQGNQIYSLWDKLSPETVAQTAAKTIEKYNQTARSPIPQLTAEQYKGFVEQAKNIQGLPEGSRARGVATQNLLKQIGQLVPSSKADKAFSLYRTGLLTGFRTPGKVVVSHAVSSGFEQAKNLPAKVADTAIGLARAPFIGKYQRGLSVTPRGNAAGAAKGTFAAVDNLIHGYDAPGSGGIAHDFANSTHFNTNTLHGKIAQAYVDTIGHLHGSLYKPFYGAQHLNSLYDMAITNAKNQGLKGAERSNFVQKFVKDATNASLKDHTQDAHAAFTTPEGAAQRANAEAAYTTFQNKTVLSEAAAGVKSKTPGARYIVPFSQIPSSIASKVVDYSPVGAIKEAIVQAKNGSFDQRALSQAIGRSATGTGLTALGYHLYNSGNITTAYPTDKKEQAQWKLEGKQANSVLVGGKWRQLASLGPAGDTLAVGANVAEGMKGNKKTPGSLTNAAIQGAVGGVNVLGNSPYLQGIQNVGAAISSPGTKSQKVAEGLAGGLIPTAVANIASATDPLQRQTNSPVDSVTNKIPGLREKNLPQVDVLGRNIARQQGPLGTLTDPFYSTTAKTDPVTSELNRLNGTYNPATPTAITKNQSIHGQKVDLNPQDLTALQQQSGQPLNQALGQLIKSGTYAQASDQNKANTISSVTTAVRDAVKNGQSVDLNSILDKAQQTLTKGIFKDSGQSTQTIGNTVYKRSKNGSVTTSKVKVPKPTKTKTPRVKTARASTGTTRSTGTRRTASTKAVKVPSFKITGAKAFRPPKGVKIKVAKSSFKAPKTQRIAVSKIPNVNKKKLG